MENDQIKILAIDDIADNLISLKALLGESFPGAKTLTTASGATGLKMAIREDPDIILLDIVMPGMDGFEVCRQLKGDKRLAEIPVVFMTALKGDRENRIKALEAGADGFLTKPIDESELTAQVRAMLKIRSANKKKRDEKELTEIALHERESRLQKIFDILPVGLWFADKDGTLIAGNPAGVRIWGAEPKVAFSDYGVFKARRLPSREEIAPEEWALARTIKEGATIKDELLEIDGFDGKTRVILNYTAPILDSEGAVQGAIVVNNDITARMEAEEKLRINEERLAFSLEATSDGLWDWNLITNEIYFSPQYYRMLGYQPNAFPATYDSWLEMIFPEDIQASEERLHKAITENGSYQTEFRMRTSDGGWKWILDRGKVIETDQNGKAMRMVGTHVDITERNQVKLIKDIQYNVARKTFEAQDVETLLSLIRHELGRLLDTTHFAAALYNPDKNTLTKLPFSNDETEIKEWPAGTSLSGLVVKTGKTLFLNSPDIEHFLRENHLMTSGSPACWLGVPIKINNSVAGAMVIKSFTDPNAYNIGNIALMELIAHETGMFIDRQNMLESLISAKEKAEESDRLKSAFISNISHEIRTPLNGIIGFNQIMAEQELSDDEKSLYLSALKSSSDRLLQTITDYMDIARIVSGTQEVSFTRFSIKSLLDDLYSRYKEKCADRSLSLIIVLPEKHDESLINSDRELIYKTLQQLIDNAVKFTDEGEIALGFRMVQDKCEFFVRDSGRGIGAGKLKEIFNMFTQEETSVTRGYEGSGLGLAIAQGLAELLGGEIHAFSEKGKGSVFSFTLPAEISEKEIIVKDKKTIETVNKSKPLVLVAEDDHVSFLYLKTVLRRAGCDYLHASNGAEAVELCRKNPSISFVLMDIKMPVMTGLEATRLIKEFNPSLPVIALTAYAQTGDQHRILEAGCDEYYAKPVTPDLLRELIKNHTLK